MAADKGDGKRQFAATIVATLVGRISLAVFSAALFVFFTTAAGTLVVASDLRTGAGGLGFGDGFGSFSYHVAGSCGWRGTRGPS